MKGFRGAACSWRNSARRMPSEPVASADCGFHSSPVLLRELRVVREKSSATRGPSPGLDKTQACSGFRCTPCHELLSGVIHASIYRLQTSVTPVKKGGFSPCNCLMPITTLFVLMTSNVREIRLCSLASSVYFWQLVLLQLPWATILPLLKRVSRTLTNRRVSRTTTASPKCASCFSPPMNATTR